MKIKTFKIFALILLFSSCKKIDTPNEQSKLLFGEWKYVSSSGGFDGNQADENFDYSSTVEFTERGKFRLNFANNSLMKGRYKIQLKDNPLSGTTETIIVYSRRQYNQFFQISNDTLYLLDDGDELNTYNYIFVK